MYSKKYLLKTFTSKITNSTIPQVNKYKGLLEKASFIAEDLFPKRVSSSEQIRQYLKIEEISKNTTIEGKEQIDSINESIFFPGWDMLKRGGKQWRPMLGLIIGNYFKMPIEEINKSHLLYKLLFMTEILHNASLIIDDVEDRSEQRRGEPCVHLKYGDGIAINVGVTMMYLPMYRVIKEIQDVGLKAKLSEIYFEEMTALHIGQGWDIEMKVEKRLPTFDNYKDTVLLKTGVFPRFIFKSIKILLEENSENTAAINEFIDITDNISIAFQIKDDLLNIAKSNLAKGKGFLGEDIYEGKLTLMVLHTLNSNSLLSRKERLKEILEMKTKDESLINEAIEIMENNKSIEFAEEIMNSHVLRVEDKCHLLAKNKNFNTEAIDDFLQLVKYLIHRNI